MIFEMRTYRLQPGSVPEVEKRFGEALTDRVKVSPLGAFQGRVKLSPLAAAGHTELGPLNQWIHIWAYKDANERARIRDESRKDGNWPPATRGMFIKQENMLVVPSSFSPLK